MKSVHLFLQHTGSVGKTAAACCLAEWYRAQGLGPLCVEFDPIYRQFWEFPPSETRRITFPQDFIRINASCSQPLSSAEFRELLEAVLSADGPVIIDTGAVVYFPLLRLFSASETQGRLREAGKQLILHQVLAGQPDYQEKTVGGAELVASALPPDTRLVIWFNEYFYPVFRCEESWQATALHQRYGSRIDGLVRYPFDTGGRFRELVSKQLPCSSSVGEYIQGAELDADEKAVLNELRRFLFLQLDGILGPDGSSHSRPSFPSCPGEEQGLLPEESIVAKLCRLGVTLDEAIGSPAFTDEEKARLGAASLSVFAQLSLLLEPGKTS